MTYWLWWMKQMFIKLQQKLKFKGKMYQLNHAFTTFVFKDSTAYIYCTITIYQIIFLLWVVPPDRKIMDLLWLIYQELYCPFKHSSNTQVQPDASQSTVVIFFLFAVAPVEYIHPVIFQIWVCFRRPKIKPINCPIFITVTQILC